MLPNNSVWSIKLLSSKSLKASKGNGTPPGTFWELPLGYKRPAQLTLIDTAIGVRLAVLFDKGTLFLLQRFLVLCPLSHSSIFAFSNDYMKTGLVGEFKWRNGLFLFWLLFCTDDDWYTFKAPILTAESTNFLFAAVQLMGRFLTTSKHWILIFFIICLIVYQKILQKISNYSYEF